MATDIQHQHLFFRKTPPAWHPYIKLARMDRPIGTWLLLLPGLWSLTLASGGLTGITPRYALYVLYFCLGAFLMRSAGCVVNDLWDRKLDAQVDRTKQRPLASGELRPGQALAFLAGLLGLSFLILLQFNAVTICLGVISLLPVAVYPLMKRVTWWPQFFLGLTFNWGALMGWAALRADIGLPALLLYAGGIGWTLAYDTVYAHQDREDDALAGIKSTARLFGGRSRPFVAGCLALSVLLFAAAIMAIGGTPYLMLFPALHAVWQIKKWRMDEPQSCLAVFKSNRIFGLLVLLACCF